MQFGYPHVRGARGDLLKIVWHDGIGMSLYAKRLERGRFIWPSPASGVVATKAAELVERLADETTRRLGAFA
jgi:transposase